MPQAKQRLQKNAVPQYDQSPDSCICLTEDGIEAFLDACRGKGLAEGTVERYRSGLNHLYQDLPEDKIIRRETLENWRKELLQQGYARATINCFLSSGNSFVEFAGHREYQLMGQLELEADPQPELTRTEYLRLLQTARALGKEKVYLLIKLFGSTGPMVQELSKLTVEAVEEGRISIVFSGVRSVVRLPESLRKELLEYAKRCGYLSGPIFLTRSGAPVNRTYVTASIRSICEDARVPREKGNPRCLKRLYPATRSGIENNISLLVEQAIERLLEEEQLAISWGE